MRDDSFIQQALYRAAQEEISAAEIKSSPFCCYRPRLTLDGDKWIACFGENIQVGVVGIGDSPYEAEIAFNKAWYAKAKP